MYNDTTGHPTLALGRYQAALPDVAVKTQRRIEAGLLEIQGRFLLTPGSEWRSYIHSAYDVFARELLKDRELTSGLLEETIPRLVSDVFLEGGWLLSEQGTDAGDENHPVRFGSYWVKSGHEQFLKKGCCSAAC